MNLLINMRKLAQTCEKLENLMMRLLHYN